MTAGVDGRMAAQRRRRRAIAYTLCLLVLVGALIAVGGFARAFGAEQMIDGLSNILTLALIVDIAVVALALAYARAMNAETAAAARKDEA